MNGERTSMNFLAFSKGRELVFFDPDNGLEIKSVKYGRKGASRYLFMREVSQSVSAGHSLLAYQHMPPKPREPFISDLASSLVRETGSESVYRVPYPTRSFFSGATERSTRPVCGNRFQSSNHLGRSAEYATIHGEEWHDDG